MKILFITDTVRRIGFEPLGIMSLSAALKEAGHETRLAMDIRTPDSFRSEIQSYNPNILAYSVTSGLHTRFVELNRQIKEELDTISVFGGPHPTFFPEMIEKKGIDAVGIGECDRSFVNYVNALEQGGSLNEILGFHVKDADGRIFTNQPEPLVENLDELPFPDREIANVSGETPGIITMMAGRGCPYRCTYCFNHAFNKIYGLKKASVRFRTVSNVIAEAREIRDKYRPKLIYFADDCLILKKDWLEQFCHAWKEEVGLPYFCNGRFNLHDEKTISLLKESGCITIIASIEAGNDYLRNEILKRSMSREQIINGAEVVRRHGMGLLVQSIVAIPRGSLKMDLETLALAVKCRPSMASCTVFNPYPRTELGELAISLGMCDSDPDKIMDDFRANDTILKLPQGKQQFRLNIFFSLAVEFRIVRLLLPLLIRLPLEKVGYLLDRIWHGYCARYRLYPPLKYPLLQTMKYAFGFVFGKSG